MRVADLHCDALYKHVTEHIPLDAEENETRLVTEPNGHKLQCYAIWLPDSYSGGQAERTVTEAARCLRSECERLGIRLLRQGEDGKAAFERNANTAYFTVENGSALNGKTENVAVFASLGVRMMTLTWNAANCIGDGADVENARGLTPFGRRAVREMERYGIIVDISHASEALFYDTAENTSLPIVASHSNAYSVAPHRRNLKDEQIRLIIRRGGLIGLNFHNAFLNADPVSACVTDILRHADHILSLGGERSLCFGSDFDGGTLPRDMHNSGIYERIAELMLHHHYEEGLVRRIFCDNALNFFENFDNRRIMV